MKTALVLEGGAMRGMYTAGVLDVFMEQGIQFDGIIGVSAGALFGVNFLSEQNGRVLRYNKKYNGNKQYMGLIPLLREGNIISTELAYRKVPLEWDVFDNEKYMQSKVPFYAVVTNIVSGEPEYMQITDVYKQMDTLRASGSMPFVSRPVILAGKEYLDGAVTDSIPFQYMLDHGYDRLVVVLTKRVGYVKKPMSEKLVNLKYQKKYPNLAKRMCSRHEMYNGQMKELFRLRDAGIAEILQTDEDIQISKIEKDPAKLDALYQAGRRDAVKWVQNSRKSFAR